MFLLKQIIYSLKLKKLAQKHLKLTFEHPPLLVQKGLEKKREN